MEKKALVLGGGGAKGAYQIGAFKAFSKMGLEWDLIIGTSIGALNGAAIVQNDYELAKELWNSIEYKNIFGDERMGLEDLSTILDIVKYTVSDIILEGTFDPTPFEDLIRKYISEEKVRASKTDFGLVTFEVPIMRGRELMIGDIPQGKFCDYLMASSTCFPIFKPKEIDGARFIDGGFHANLPLKFAVAQQATEIVSIELETIGLIREIVDKRDSAMVRIRSYWDLGAIFGFDKNLYQRNKVLGYNDTMKAFGHYEGMFYTFKQGECRKNADTLSAGIAEASDRVSGMLKRVILKTLNTISKRTTLAFVAKGSWAEDTPQMLCRVAELAGQVFELEPTEVYLFEEFNDKLIAEHQKRGGLFLHKGEEPLDIASILASVSHAVDSRTIVAQITGLMLNNKPETEILWTLAELLPRDFIAAIYIKMLLDSKGIS